MKRGLSARASLQGEADAVAALGPGATPTATLEKIVDLGPQVLRFEGPYLEINNSAQFVGTWLHNANFPSARNRP